MKKRVTDMFHVDPDLMRSAGFQFTLYQRYITEPFQYFIMCHGIFSIFSFGISIEYFAKTLMTADMGAHCSAFLLHITPNKCNILAMNSVVIKLLRQTGNSLLCFSQHHQPAGVLINAMNKSKAG